MSRAGFSAPLDGLRGSAAVGRGHWCSLIKGKRALGLCFSPPSPGPLLGGRGGPPPRGACVLRVRGPAHNRPSLPARRSWWGCRVKSPLKLRCSAPPSEGGGNGGPRGSGLLLHSLLAGGWLRCICFVFCVPPRGMAFPGADVGSHVVNPYLSRHGEAAGAVGGGLPDGSQVGAAGSLPHRDGWGVLVQRPVAGPGHQWGTGGAEGKRLGVPALRGHLLSPAPGMGVSCPAAPASASHPAPGSPTWPSSHTSVRHAGARGTHQSEARVSEPARGSPFLLTFHEGQGNGLLPSAEQKRSRRTDCT